MRVCHGIDGLGRHTLALLPRGPALGTCRTVARRLGRALLVALVCLPAGCGDAGQDGGEGAAALPTGAVAAGTPQATAAGLDILARGGNAADAAVAISLALAVTEPARSGLGGGLVVLLRSGTEEPTVLHAPVEALAAAPPSSNDGSGAATTRPLAAIPALLPVLATLHGEHGSGQFTWSDLVQPAIRLAAEGHPLGRLTHRTIVQEYARMLADPGAATLVLAGNRGIPAEGTTVRNPALASTLEAVAREGPGALYGGDLARRLLRGLRDRGISVGSGVLDPPPASRRVEAIRTSFRDHVVWAPPEPFGGPRLLRGLRLLESAPVELWRAGEPFLVPWLAEAVALSMSPRDVERDGDAPSGIPPLPVPPGPGSGEEGRGDASPGRAAPGLAPRPDPASGGGGETTHFSVADGQGMVISATQSLGRPFGSGIPAGDLGFFLGDARGAEVDAVPGPRPRLEGGALADSVEEAEVDDTSDETGRMLAWATPTLIEGEGRLLALGSPGGPRGVSAVLQVMARWIVDPGELPRIVRARRLHVGPGIGERGRLYLEGFMTDPTSHTMRVAPAPWTDSLRSALAARGFLPSERDIGLLFDGLSPWFGGVNAVMRLDGEWSAVADPRRDGHGGVPGGSATPALTPPGGVGAPPPQIPGG